ncbi:MAG: peptidase M22 [Deltaproteobacteria bacterium]
MTLYLGLDTSAYTTSLAIVDQEDNIILDKRIVLEVKQGERGLRQSDALFLHIKNLPFLFKELTPDMVSNIRAIAVSAAPRGTADSYMPVFLAGLAQAEVLSSFNNLPLFKVSHQEGHLMAGLRGFKDSLLHKTFLAVHFSGGTSEILQVQPGRESFFVFKLLAAGNDLHAGQLVDRIGVAMGLPFPSGPRMEELARLTRIVEISIPSAVDDRGFSFSGPEAAALRMIETGIDQGGIAFAVFRVIANTLEKVLLTCAESTGIRDVMLVGGVMANGLIGERLRERLEHPSIGLKLHFAEPKLSSDNAVGIAMLAAEMHDRQVTG